jgi:hypothetical protein
VKAPCILMVQTIKCPRCKNIVDIYVLKEAKNSSNKPIYNPVQEKPELKPVEETKAVGELING